MPHVTEIWYYPENMTAEEIKSNPKTKSVGHRKIIGRELESADGKVTDKYYLLYDAVDEHVKGQIRNLSFVFEGTPVLLLSLLKFLL